MKNETVRILNHMRAILISIEKIKTLAKESEDSHMFNQLLECKLDLIAMKTRLKEML